MTLDPDNQIINLVLNNQKGSAHLLILIVALGILLYILLTSTASFKDKLFSTLYPKPASQAEGLDQNLDQRFMFRGRNIYAPTVILDEGTYKMWYGGWQTNADFPDDKIYYRTSNDNEHWSDPVTVLTASMVNPQTQHVNDPSVTKHLNEANKQWQYTMFYTVCKTPCEQEDNEIWSSTSGDGIHWDNYQLLLAGSSGPAEPSAVIDPNGEGFWKVYYVDRIVEHNKVKVAIVNGNRNAISAHTVYTYPGNDAISGPDVKYFNKRWHLFYNRWFTEDNKVGGVNIHKVVADSNLSFPSQYQELVNNIGNQNWCGSVTPFVLPVKDNIYDLYFALNPKELPCSVAKNESIHRWRWSE